MLRFYNVSMFVLWSVLAGPSLAAEVVGGRYDRIRQAIALDITGVSNAPTHRFKLVLDPHCDDTSPARCYAQLVETRTADGVEAVLNRKVFISLARAGLNHPYFSQAVLTVFGDRQTSVTVQLPAIP